MEVSLGFHEPVTVSGQAFIVGEPLTSGHLYLMTQSEFGMESLTRTITDHAGNFVFKDIKPGPYMMVAFEGPNNHHPLIHGNRVSFTVDAEWEPRSFDFKRFGGLSGSFAKPGQANVHLIPRDAPKPILRESLVGNGFQFRDITPGVYTLKVFDQYHTGRTLAENLTITEGMDLDLGILSLSDKGSVFISLDNGESQKQAYAVVRGQGSGFPMTHLFSGPPIIDNIPEGTVTVTLVYVNRLSGRAWATEPRMIQIEADETVEAILTPHPITWLEFQAKPGQKIAAAYLKGPVVHELLPELSNTLRDQPFLARFNNFRQVPSGYVKGADVGVWELEVRFQSGRIKTQTVELKPGMMTQIFVDEQGFGVR